MNKVYTLFISLLCVSSVFSQTDETEKGIEFIKEFYSNYLTTCDKVPMELEELDRLKAENCTVELIKRLDERSIDYDPFLDAQDCSVRWLESFKISRVNTDQLKFRVNYETGYQNQIASIDLTLVPNRSGFLIDAVGRIIQSSDQEICFGRICDLTQDEINNCGPNRLVDVKSSKEVIQLAQKDIAKGTPFLIIEGSTVPSIGSSDLDFEKRYKIYLFRLGDAYQQDESHLTLYNKEIFKYLSKMYGDSWFKNARQDILGLDDWIKSK